MNTSKTRKGSKKNGSESDSDEDVETVTNKKKKQCRKDEKLEVVSELKALHGQQYTPMQYRIWGEMIIGGLYSSETECPSTLMFARAGGNQPKKKSDFAEALSEVAKRVCCILRSCTLGKKCKWYYSKSC